MDYSEIADHAQSYPDAYQAYDGMVADTNSLIKPIDARMVNERTIYGLLSSASAESFLVFVESSSEIPERVKSWFKPSESGIDITTEPAVQMIDFAVASGIITESEGGLVKGYGYDSKTKWPNLELGHVIKALRMRSEGLV